MYFVAVIVALSLMFVQKIKVIIIALFTLLFSIVTVLNVQFTIENMITKIETSLQLNNTIGNVNEIVSKPDKIVKAILIITPIFMLIISTLLSILLRQAKPNIVIIIQLGISLLLVGGICVFITLTTMNKDYDYAILFTPLYYSIFCMNIIPILLYKCFLRSTKKATI